MIGESIDVDSTMAIWNGIRDDISAIRAALSTKGVVVKSSGTGKTSGPTSAAVNRREKRQPIAATPLPRTERSNRKRSGASVVRHTYTRESIPDAPAITPAQRRFSSLAEPQDTPDRDNKGRFVVRSGGAFSHDNIVESSSENIRNSRIIGATAEKIASAVTDASSGLEETDPTVKAFSEIAQPIARGYQLFSSGTGNGDRESNRWFRRIFGEIKLFRKEDGIFSKITNKRLKNIEEKPTEPSRSGFLSFLFAGGILSAILSKIPAIGALISSAGNIVDILHGNKAKGAGGIAGTLAGMIGGAKLGAYAGSFGGPIVAAIGGAIGGVAGLFFGNTAGQIIGDKVGSWTAYMKRADIPGKITASWQSFSDSFFGKINATWDSITDYIKDKFGIDVKGKVTSASKAVKNSFVGKAASGISNQFKYATDKASELGQSIKSRVTGSASKNKEALIRQMKLAGINDPKEQAMFLAQMDHESAGFSRMDESFNYRSADRIMEVSRTARNKGRTAIEQAMSQGPEAVAELMYGGRMGNANPGDGFRFRGRGHTQLTGRSNYAAAGKDLGIDLVNYPDLAAKPEIAAKIAIWYWQKNNLGNTARTGNVASVTRKINGGLNGLSDRESKYADYLAYLSGGNNAMPAAINNTRDFSIPKVTDPQVFSSSFSPAPIMPAQPKLTPAPKIVEPLATGSGSRSQQVVVAQSNEVGQDLKDRRIAHIVTGGLSD